MHQNCKQLYQKFHQDQYRHFDKKNFFNHLNIYGASGYVLVYAFKQNISLQIFLKFVMQAKEDLDYEQDVQNLKRVWGEIKNPVKRTAKQADPRSQTATQTKILNESKQQSSKEKKNKVVVSEQNLKKTVRNPKQKHEEVIEIVTKPQKTYSDAIRNQRNKVAPDHLIITNPEGQNLVSTEALKQALAERDYELSLLRVSNSHNEDKIRKLGSVIQSKDDTIEELRNRERQLTNQLSALGSKDLNFNYGKVEYENYRHDSRRLLKLLKTTNQYNKFAEFALDDDGVRFLTNVNKTVKTKLDTPTDQNHFHFCTCNKAFIPQAFLWVPQKVYDYGKDFIKSRNGEVSQAELQLLQYQLNKIWREREKRIVNHVNSLKANEVGKYKRKLQEQSRGRERTVEVE